MSKNDKKSVIIVITAMILLILCSCVTREPDYALTDSQEVTYVEPTESTEEVSEGLSVPEESSILPGTVWSAGIYAYVYDLKQKELESHCYRSYEYAGGNVRARIETGNQMDETQSFLLLILADGKPILFDAEGEKGYSLNLIMEKGIHKTEVSFDPGFMAGRVDFILIADIPPQATSYYAVTYTVYLGDMTEKAAYDPIEQMKSVPQIETVRGMANGYGLFGILREPGEKDEDFSYTGGRTYSIGEDHQVLFDLVSGYVGRFRTILFFGDKPITFTADGTVFESFVWESDTERMIHQEMTLEIPEDLEGRYLYAISVPLERNAMECPPLFSAKYRLVEDK